MKPIDLKAASIQWGIEIETRIPASSGVSVGGYHAGFPVRTGLDKRDGLPLRAPDFHADHWKAERDGSIRCEAHQIPCEFVSPILHGESGVEHLAAFVEWLHGVGASVDRYGARHWAVWLDGQLLAVTLYKKGALEVAHVLTRLLPHPGKEVHHATQAA
jgi:hypothetical protein